MMIMAQHHRLQQHKQSLKSSENNCQQKKQYSFEFVRSYGNENHSDKTTSKITNNRASCGLNQLIEQHNQHSSLEQDGKRTLIKNQLNLIEQLQLENANLRNERDQLQLENEELKFQLQIISSSNILNQPGATFNDQQLERLVESGRKLDEKQLHQPHLTPESNTANSIGGSASASSTQADSSLVPPPLRPSDNNIECSNDGTAYSSCAVTKTSSADSECSINAPVNCGPAAASGNENGNNQTSSLCYQATSSNDFVVNSNKLNVSFYCNAGGQESDRGVSADKFIEPAVLAGDTISEMSISVGNRSMSVPIVTRDNNKPSASDSGDNVEVVGAHASDAPESRELSHEEDDDEHQVKLVEQLYGDAELVQAAAVTIQRAFRRYQICKRFRTITEQLRHTYQSSAVVSRADLSRRQEISTEVSLEALQVSSNVAGAHATGCRTAEKGSSASGGGVFCSDGKISSGGSRNSSGSGNTPLVSGTTRAAAWESLSYAASRLQAAAAGITSSALSKQQHRQAQFNWQQHQQSSLASNINIASIATTGDKSNSRLLFDGKAPTSIDSKTPIGVSLDNQQMILSQQLNQNKQMPSVEDSITNREPHKSYALTTATNAIKPTTTTSSPASNKDQVFAAALNFQQLESIRKRQYRVGLHIFNKNPEKGISFLVAQSFIDASPPYTKTSSFYHYNQLHFIDNKQHLIHQDNHIERPTRQNSSVKVCQLCNDEDNLKRNIARFLLQRKGLAKERIGQYLGNLQSQFNQDVLNYYLCELDFNGLQIDLALRKFLATFRLPGEAQKIEKIVDSFARRYVQCQQQSLCLSSSSVQLNQQLPLESQLQQQQLTNSKQKFSSQQCLQQSTNVLGSRNNLTHLSKDEIFILTFAIIMLNTDLHSPSLKSTSRMSAVQFVNNLRGVFKSQNVNESDLIEIYERVKANQITTAPDHVNHVMKVQQGLTVTNFQKKELPNLCVPHRRLVCFCRLFEVQDFNKKEKVGQHQREVFLFNDMLLVTKLARRVRTGQASNYTYRQSIPLQGIFVQLFQSQHYSFGIKLCRRSNGEPIIMFNARNELDQSRFFDDLSESVAEMDEIEFIRAHNIIESIHFKQMERLRQHAATHARDGNIRSSDNITDNRSNQILGNINNCDTRNFNTKKSIVNFDDKLSGSCAGVSVLEINGVAVHSNPLASGSGDNNRKSKFSSMLNLLSIEESKDEEKRTERANQPKSKQGLRYNKSFAPDRAHLSSAQPQAPFNRQLSNEGSNNRRCSTSSIHSLDSGLFLSRDVSPNQSS